MLLSYKEQIAHPLWQKKRLEVFERDNYTCQICLDKDTQLHVHHTEYDKTYQTMAWQYPNNVYKTLCKDCHQAITEHLEEYGNDKEFNVMKIKKDGKKTVLIYTNGLLRFNVDNEKTEWMNITEDSTHKIVQFLINNWLKNG